MVTCFYVKNNSIFKFFFRVNTPQLLQRKRIPSNYINHVFRTCAYSSHQVSSWSLHSKRFPALMISGFQDSRFPPPSPYVPGSDSNLKWSIWGIRSFYISGFIKIWSPICKISLLDFHILQDFQFPPQTSPNVTRSGWDLKWEIWSTRSF